NPQPPYGSGKRSTTRMPHGRRRSDTAMTTPARASPTAWVRSPSTIGTTSSEPAFPEPSDRLSLHGGERERRPQRREGHLRNLPLAAASTQGEAAAGIQRVAAPVARPGVDDLVVPILAAAGLDHEQ